MFYTYIIESIRYPGKRYIGHTGNVEHRIIDHNDGKCKATKHFRPWKLAVYVAFETLDQAQERLSPIGTSGMHKGEYGF